MDEVNEIIIDAGDPIVEEANEHDDQTVGSLVETTNNSAIVDEEQVPDKIQSGNIDTPTDDPPSDNDDEEVADLYDNATEEAHSGIETITNDTDGGQFDDEVNIIEPEGRYNLRTRTNVNYYKHMHKYGET